uniref:Glycerol-3-phosphate dehydrogenase [NAD(P)+] n=1 Tax=Cyanothece sp. (strain PCC 7425 / ATCC 29141) TaxID=395961 RepID=B8HKD2_CYAP4
MSDPPSITILGLGAWGKTLYGLLEQQGYPVVGWRRSQGNLATVASAKLIVAALPIKAVRAVAEQVAALNPSPDTILLSATKGLEPGTTQTAADIWQSLLPQLRVVVLSGPNISVEIEQGLPAATVVGGDESAAAEVQQILGSPAFRVYTNPDRRGVELGGILKNVMAIACGANDGLKLGVNSRAALITRGLVEMIRVGTHWGGQVATFYGLSGLGDLLATCTSPLSRNYQVGWHLAQGKSLEQVLDELVGTAEGVNTAKVLYTYAQDKQLAVPITQEVYAVILGQHSPTQAIANLLERPFKPEL